MKLLAALSGLIAAFALSSCALFNSPGSQVYIEAAVDIAVATAEAKGVAGADINRIAKLALAADAGTSATLAAISSLVNAQITALKLPAGDQAAAAILEVALSAAIQARIGANPSLASAQAAIADILNYVIAASGG